MTDMMTRDEPTTQRFDAGSAETFEKPWFDSWLEKLRGLSPTEQAIGLWMAYYADANGVLDEYTWDDLAEQAGLRGNSVRKIMRRPDCMLIVSGLVERHDRRIGGVVGIPLFTLDVSNPA